MEEVQHLFNYSFNPETVTVIYFLNNGIQIHVDSRGLKAANSPPPFSQICSRILYVSEIA